MVQRELTDNPTGGVPGRVTQPELSECDVVLTPAPAPPAQLQAVGGGAGVDSATEDVPGESGPHPGTAGY